MTPRDAETPEADPTLTMLTAVADGTLTGLARYHLLKRQLLEIRNLPESNHNEEPSEHD